MKTYAQPLRAPSLSERKQESVREVIGAAASRLFLDQGFQAATIDDIAEAAGIGRRTFFRYFETKEDVVLWKFDQFARHVVTLIAARPAREQALLALQRAMTEASEFYNQEPAQTLALLKLTEATPSLYAQQLVQQDRWKGWFAQALRKRTRASVRSLAPELVSAVGLEATAIAVRRWVNLPGSNLSDLIAASFAGLRKILVAKV
jgi:AcrR family transcriptional regulator